MILPHRHNLALQAGNTDITERQCPDNRRTQFLFQLCLLSRVQESALSKLHSFDLPAKTLDFRRFYDGS
jgi:hypothetical protein